VLESPHNIYDVHSVPDTLGTRPDLEAHTDAIEQAELDRLYELPARAPRERWRRAVRELRWPLGIYLLRRFFYLLVALGDLAYKHWSLKAQVSNWDGVWYLVLAGHGYPHHVSHLQTTLGFFPLYPALVWLLSHVLFCGYVIAGVLISMIGGFVTTVLVQRMAASWWDEDAGKRAALFYVLFPGSIVFSMVYSEGLMLPLAAGCLYALQKRKWVLAGLLAAGATATAPLAFSIILACAAAAFVELRRRGWKDREARRSLLAPLLAPLGAVLFGAFLWLWTGSPFASYTAQRYGWDERSTPIALWHTIKKLWHQLMHLGGLHHPGINLNYVSGLLGAAFLAWAFVLMWRHRREIPIPAIWWTIGIAILTLTSENVPPNPRMLICAFPALMVVAYELRGRNYNKLIAATTVLLFAMSFASFVGTGLRP
jgi:hypothetical protein